MSPSNSLAVHAAGAVVWRVTRRTLEVLLVHRPRYDDWSWPKGKVDPGELLPACAVREVAEETGLRVVLGQPLPPVSYRVDDGRKKVCHYWAASVVPEDGPIAMAQGAVAPVDPDEVDEMAWMPATKARALLSRPSDRTPLDALTDLWDEGSLQTVAVLLVRHGRARKRSAWPSGDEQTRPLTETGATQARSIVPLLAAFGVERVVSSPWERCLATVRPYAESAGIVVETAPELTEEAHKSRPRQAKAVVDALLREAGPALAVCVHRPVLPSLVTVLDARAPRRVAKRLPSKDPYLRTGEVLIAHVRSGRGKRLRVWSVETHRGSSNGAGSAQ